MEILAPAGSFQKLKYAVLYGANAVYTAGKSFGLRAKSTNLSEEELKEACIFCHEHNCKLYVTVNIYAHNAEIKDLPAYFTFLQTIGVDAIIISDPGVFALAREYAPDVAIHISTQANVTSWKTAEFWYKQGAKRVILARELSIQEIKEIKNKVPKLELEIFVHGAMCMSYSGRCLLSSFLNKRSANRGNCTQPCRWKYHLMEESRPGEFFPIIEDKQGTYILNSKDLCLYDRLAEIIEAGLDSIKIEGRMKSLYYVANVTRTYRKAIELIKAGQRPNEELKAELDKVSHRHYTEAFFNSFDSADTQYHETSAYIRNYQFVGEVTKTEDKSASIAVKAKSCLSDEIEFIFPDNQQDLTWLVDNITNEDGEEIPFTKPNTIVKVNLPKQIPTDGIVRIKIKK